MNKTELKKLKNEIEAKQKELQAYCHEQFKLGTKDLFDENPELKSFGFKGYIPFFNDGDECVFSVHIDEPDINGVDGYDISYEDPHKGLQALQSKVNEFLSAFDEDFYQKIFGDHFQVVIKADKISVKKYSDHD